MLKKIMLLFCLPFLFVRIFAQTAEFTISQLEQAKSAAINALAQEEEREILLREELSAAQQRLGEAVRLRNNAQRNFDDAKNADDAHTALGAQRTENNGILLREAIIFHNETSTDFSIISENLTAANERLETARSNLHAVENELAVRTGVNIISADDSAQKTTASTITNEAENQRETATFSGVINGIEVIFVEAGEFIQGGALFGNSRRRRVRLSRGFWIGKYPVTQLQFQAVMGSNPSRRRGNPNNPVERVTWREASRFAALVGGRLPTEAEWEFAARGGNKSKGYIFSGGNDLDEVAWYSENAQTTQPVGFKKANELGIHDMSGNVMEWVYDIYESFIDDFVTDPIGGSSGFQRVWRGSSYRMTPGSSLIAQRRYDRPGNRSATVGFRIVFDAQ